MKEPNRYFYGEKSLVNSFFIFTGIGLLIILIILGNLFCNGYLTPGEIIPSVSGNIGDFIGGVTGAIFGIATIILVWLTYKSQQLELTATRNLISTQVEDNNFFSLFNSFETYKLNLSFVSNISRTVRRQATTESNIEASNVLSGTIFFQTRYLDQLKNNINKNDLKSEFDKFYIKNIAEFGTYFKYIKSLLGAVLKQGKDGFYFKVFNSSLTTYELLIINFSLHSDIFDAKEKEIIRSLGILNDLIKNPLILKENQLFFNIIIQ